MSFNKNQFENLIRRVLTEFDMCSDSAVNLLLGTAAQESHFGTYIRQVRGPAVGVFQMEPDTFNWLRDKYLVKFTQLEQFKCEDLEWDLSAAIIFARLRYRAIPKSLPPADDIRALAEYWKKYYNTIHGAGTVAEFISNYDRFVLI